MYALQFENEIISFVKENEDEKSIEEEDEIENDESQDFDNNIEISEEINGVYSINHSKGKYVGNLKNGRFDGFGVFYENTGKRVIRGEYKNWRLNGRVYVKTADGSEYMGWQTDGKYNGYGYMK